MCSRPSGFAICDIHYGKDGIQLYCLEEAGEYQLIDRNVAFPLIAVSGLITSLEQRRETDEHSVIRAFVEWVFKARSE
jgi:hypothetical protein